jgi:hypothetical protein
MNETYIFAAIALIVTGMAIGVLVMVSLGIKRDDRPDHFPADTRDLIASAARRVNGVGIRRPEVADEARRRPDILPV